MSVRLEEGLQEKTSGQVYLQRGTFNQQDLGQTWRLQQGQASWKEGAGEIWKTVLERAQPCLQIPSASRFDTSGHRGMMEGVCPAWEAGTGAQPGWGQ